METTRGENGNREERIHPRSGDCLELVAYWTAPHAVMPLVPASRNRDWMEATEARFANRCLPLLIANQAGWFILSNHELRITWDGTEKRDGVRVEVISGEG